MFNKIVATGCLAAAAQALKLQAQSRSRSKAKYMDDSYVWYSLGEYPKNWWDAENECNQWGGNLAMIDSQETQDYINDFLGELNGDYWIGLNEHEMEAKWKWSNGKEYQHYENWHPGQPKTEFYSYDQDCAALSWGQWADYDCAKEKEYICEYRHEPYKPKYEYQLSHDRKNWWDAEEECVQWGGHLASIEDWDEQWHLMDQAAQLQIERENTWIGYSDLHNEGHWSWVDGSESTHTDWATGEPNNWAWTEHCAGMYDDFYWNDFNCWSEHRYLCKKPKGQCKPAPPKCQEWEMHNEDKTECVPKCPWPQEWDHLWGFCYLWCPESQYPDLDMMNCLDKCAWPQYWSHDMQHCTIDCGEGQQPNYMHDACEDKCHHPLMWDVPLQECIPACPEGEMVDETGTMCVAEAQCCHKGTKWSTTYKKCITDDEIVVKAGDIHWMEPVLHAGHGNSFVRYQVKANTADSQVIGAYSTSLVPWKQEGVDAITWYLGTNDEKFTFRQNMFEPMDLPNEWKETFQLNVGEWYTVEVYIEKNFISYSVNGKTFSASGWLEDGVMLEHGQIGMVSYKSEFSYRNFEQWPYKWECPVCGPEQTWDPVMYACSCPEGTQHDWMDWTQCVPSCHGDQYYEHKFSMCVDWCPAGQEHVFDHGAVTCQPIKCEPGHAFDHWSYECKACPAGNFSPDGLHCTPCAAGQYVDFDAATQCHWCWPGTFSQQAGSTVCTPCPAGNVAGMDGASHCTHCEAGWFSANNVVCEKCPVGTWSTTEATTCEPIVCPEGEELMGDHCAPAGPTECTPGHQLMPATPTSPAYCMECTPGTFWNQGTSACEPCPAALYQPGWAQTSCMDCPMGMQPEMPAAGNSQCVAMTCPEGEVLVGNNCEINTPLECPEGEVPMPDFQNVMVCQNPCDDGTVATYNSAGEWQCACPTGMVYGYSGCEAVVECPEHQHNVYNQCVDKCYEDQHWFVGAEGEGYCKDNQPEPACPEGQHGVSGQCCPQGQHWYIPAAGDMGYCKDDTPTCPEGEVPLADGSCGMAGEVDNNPGSSGAFQGETDW